MEQSSFQYFTLKLVSPRPTFPADITPEEGFIMQQHMAYWQQLMAEGTALIYGPVMDPQGPYGLAVVKVPDAGTAQYIADNDPAMKITHYEVFQMMAMVPQQ